MLNYLIQFDYYSQPISKREDNTEGHCGLTVVARTIMEEEILRKITE